jgi:fructan beta-fructosidase
MKRCYTLSLTLIVAIASYAQNEVIPTPQWRPLYHFTPLKNWTNDPNGLVYIKGVYHMYNQQNPFGNKWGHMSWGHATSTDLVQWKHLPIAMLESIDKDTTWRFSGSAVWDKNNTSGFSKKGGCIVAVYTADQPNLKKESQFIAYSNDGGWSLINYSGNPVIDLHRKDFRDPNVSWIDQLKKWLMVVSLPPENKVQFYSSGNLKNWDLISEFGPAGLKGGIWECPSFFQLPVSGKPGVTKWVLMASFGGSRDTMMQYFIGDFDGTTFRNDNPSDATLLVDHGDCFYAAIPWNNLPNNQKTFIGWMVPTVQETYPWRGQMSIPRDLVLRETKYRIRLFQEPAAIIKNNLSKFSGKPIELKNVRLDTKEEQIFNDKNICGNSYWLEAELDVQPNTTAGFKIAGRKNGNQNITGTEIGYDAAKHQVYVDRSNSDSGKINQKKVRLIADVIETGGKIKFEILFDKSSLEVFVNNGEKVITTYIFPEKDENLLSAFALGGKAVIPTLKIWDLSKVKPVD